MGKKKEQIKLTFYRYKQDNKQYIYVLKFHKLNFWQRLMSRIYDYPPHIDVLYEKMIIIYED